MKLKVALLLLFGTITVLFALLGAQAGHLSVDEVTYHLMTRDLLRTGGFAILNGYQDFPSAEFVLPVTVVRGGQLISQYPPLYAAVAAPFYAMIGYQGLFLVNSLAFCAALWLCYLTAHRVFDDRTLSLNACLIFAFATFAWDYAQAAWPHALSVLVAIGSVYLVLRSLQSEARTKAILWASAAGLVVGLGVGVRVDAVFVLPALVFVLVFARPVRLGSAAAVILGMVPPLAVVTAINHARFGIASPFTYGRDASNWAAGSPMGYLPLVALALAFAAAVWPLTRPAGRAFAAAHRWPIAGGAILLAGASLMIPEVWAMVARLASGFYQLVIDLRVRDLSIQEGALSRGPGGSMIYMTGLKKSLLQSCPYLVVLIVPIWAILRGRPHALPMTMLLLVPVTFIGVYSYFAWHGGLSLNLRYFSPVLPFTAILTAYAWCEVTRRSGNSRLGLRLGIVLALLLALGWAIVGLRPNIPIALEEELLLTLSLRIAAVVLMLGGAFLMATRVAHAAVARATQCSLVVAFAWSTLITFGYDVPLALKRRGAEASVSRSVAPVVAPGSLIVTQGSALFESLYDRSDIRIATSYRDDFASFRPLVQSYFRSGRAVYGWFYPATLRRMRERGLLKSITVQPLGTIRTGIFARLTPSTSDTARPVQQTHRP